MFISADDGGGGRMCVCGEGGGWGGGGHGWATKLVFFDGRQKCMMPNSTLQLMKNASLHILIFKNPVKKVRKDF